MSFHPPQIELKCTPMHPCEARGLFIPCSPHMFSLPQPTSCLEPDLNIVYDSTFPSSESPLSPIGGWASMCSPCVMHYFSSRLGELSLCLTDCIACWSLPRDSMQPPCNLPQLGAAQAYFTELTVSFPFINMHPNAHFIFLLHMCK